MKKTEYLLTCLNKKGEKTYESIISRSLKWAKISGESLIRANVAVKYTIKKIPTI